MKLHIFGVTLAHDITVVSSCDQPQKLLSLQELAANTPTDDVTHGCIGCCYSLPHPVGALLATTGAFLYPPGGGQWWHTNSNLPGRRIYAAYSETGESGMLFYRDGKVVVDKDQPGWNVREFVVPCWHAVWSECWRTSYGFNIGVEA